MSYESLSTAVQHDIAENLIDQSEYLAAEGWTATDFRELLVDLIEPIKLSTFDSPLGSLLKQAASRGVSDLAVNKLQVRLTISGDLDPVIVDGERLIDGRHRVEAYARAGRATIPAVDIGPLLRIDWERWTNGGVQ